MTPEPPGGTLAAAPEPSPLDADKLWAAIPAGMRLTRFRASTVPGQYRDAFVDSSAWRAGIDLSGLPGPMQREVAWCVFRVIELGGKISTPLLGMLARRMGEVTADLGARARHR